MNKKLKFTSLYHAGVGEPLTLKQCRMLLALRINVLVKGYRSVYGGLCCIHCQIQNN